MAGVVFLASTSGKSAAGLRSESVEGHPSVRRITLEEAQQQVQAADNPMVRLAKLQVEAARQHRLGTPFDYFPKLDGTSPKPRCSRRTSNIGRRCLSWEETGQGGPKINRGSRLHAGHLFSMAATRE